MIRIERQWCILRMSLLSKNFINWYKKNYAAIQTLQEGNIVPDENMNDLAITGLAIKKSTLPKQRN